MLAVSTVLVLFPLVYQVGLSFKPESAVFLRPLLPFEWPPTVENYRRVFETVSVPRAVLNSLLYATAAAVGQTVLGVLAAYAFVFRDFRGKAALWTLVLVTLTVPSVVTLFPNYLTVSSLGLLDTVAGMALPSLASGYAVFLLRQSFRNFPRSILEAAQIDGASTLQTLRYVLVPANIGPIIALGVTVFINTWNEFVWPLLVATRPEAQTMNVVVQRFASSEGGSAWGPIMAAATLAILPTVLLFLLVRRGVMQTLTEGAVKG